MQRARAARSCRIAITILITPATPAAAWVWPMLDLTEPSHSGAVRGAVLPVGGQQRLRPRSGRPAGCRCRAPRPRRCPPAPARRRPAPCAITRCWDGPLGAVSPLLAPSWLTALPRTTASTWCPLRRASDRRSSSSTPDALGQAGAVGGRGERLAPPVGGQPALAGELDERARGWPSRSPRRPAPASIRRCAAPGRPGAAPPARRSTRCPPSPPGPQARTYRPPGPTTTLRRVAAYPGSPRRLRRTGAAARRSREYITPANTPVRVPRSGPGRSRPVSSASQASLQQQPLLRVHRQRLPRADPEERRVELGRVVQEPAAARATSPARPGRPARQIPAPSAGNPETASTPPATSSHSSSGIRDPAGEPAAHPHDRHRLANHGRPRPPRAGRGPAPGTGQRPVPQVAGQHRPGSGSRRPAWPAAAARWPR